MVYLFITICHAEVVIVFWHTEVVIVFCHDELDSASHL